MLSFISWVQPDVMEVCRGKYIFQFFSINMAINIGILDIWQQSWINPISLLAEWYAQIGAAWVFPSISITIVRDGWSSLLCVMFVVSVPQDSSSSSVVREWQDICSHSGYAWLVQSGHLCELPEGFIRGVWLCSVQLSHQRLSGDMTTLPFHHSLHFYVFLYLYISGVCVFVVGLFTVLHHIRLASFCFSPFCKF